MYYRLASAVAAILVLIAAAGAFVAVLVTRPCGGITLVSRATGASGTKGNGYSATAELASISADGGLVVFDSGASNLHPDDTDTTVDMFVRDLRTDQTALASRATGASGAKGNGSSRLGSMSADGRFVAFRSAASNLHTDDTDTTSDVFVRDLQTNQTVLASRATGASGAKGNGSSEPASISADGRFVAFQSPATNLHPDDTDATVDVFVRDLQTNQTVLASRATGASGAKGNGSSWPASISADGRFLAFQSQATNLHPNDTDAKDDVFVRDLQTNQTGLASRATGASGAKGNGVSNDSSMSRYGRFVAFRSEATNLHPDDTDAVSDILVRNMQTDQTVLASRAGRAGAKGNGYSDNAAISADGRFIAFYSLATNLHPDDSDTQDDVSVSELCPAMPEPESATPPGR